MTKKKTGSSKPRGRPASAIAGDFATVVEKSNWELDKFNAKVANNMGKILEEYYQMAFDDKLKENTRLTVLKDLIKMQKELVGVVEATEDLEKKMDKDDDDDSTLDMGNIISLDFEEKKQM